MDRSKHCANQASSVIFNICTVFLVAVAYLAGCSSPQADQSLAVSQEKNDVTVTANDPEDQRRPRQSSAARLSELIDQSGNDLAKRLNVDVADITVVEARHVIWPDGSAGCPMPGYEYMQMLMEGVLIRLNAGGRT